MRKEWLREEIKKWKEENIINEEQARLLIERYSLDEESVGGTIRSLVILGSILLGTGLIAFFIKDIVNLSLFAIPIITIILFSIAYSVGFYLKYIKKTYENTGTGLIFLGSLIFGAGVLGLTFHGYRTVFPGFIIWGAGIFPLFLLLKMEIIGSLSIVTIILWRIKSLLFSSAVSSVLLLLLAFYSYKKKYFWMFTISVIGLSIWVMKLCLGLKIYHGEAIYVLWGVLLWSAGLLLRKRKRWSILFLKL